VSAAASIEPARLAAAPACALLERFLRSPEHAWSIGIAGAIGEFMHDAGEALELSRQAGHLSARTARGGLFLSFPDELYLRARRCVSTCNPGAMQRVDVLLPAGQAAMPVCRVLTELDGAGQRQGALFDLGLGSPWVRFCVRSSDDHLTAVLRRNAGRGVFEHGSTVLEVLKRHSPARVVLSALGRLEVYGPVPGRAERSPEGPHTHLLPHLLDDEQLPEADGYVPVLSLYPAKPAVDKYGRPRPRYDHEAAAELEALHARFGGGV